MMRAVVAEQRVVIRIDAEASRFGLGAPRRWLGLGHWAPVLQPNAEATPFLERAPFRHVAHGEAAVGAHGNRVRDPLADGGRELHLAAPRLVALPAPPLQVVGNRR